MPLVYCASFGQNNTKRIHGNVTSLNNDVSNVLIINLNSKKSTITDSLGVFSIEAKLNDLIRFTAVQYLPQEVVVTEAIFLQNTFAVNLVENVISLNEVTVTPYNLTGEIGKDIQRLDIEPVITSSKLHLPNADLEVMSYGERLLLLADRGEYARFMTIEEKIKYPNILGFLTIGAVINPEKIINRLSGRTKVFENVVAHDLNMDIGKEIIAKFSKKTIAESFDIPEEYIDGFLTYCMSQKGFTQLSQAGNTAEIWEYLKAKSIKFKETEPLNE